MSLIDFFSDRNSERNKKKIGRIRKIEEVIENGSEQGHPDSELIFAYLASIAQTNDSRLQPPAATVCRRALLTYIRQAHFTAGYVYGPVENITSIAPGETMDVRLQTTSTTTLESETGSRDENTVRNETESATKNEIVDRLTKTVSSGTSAKVGGSIGVISAGVGVNNSKSEVKEKVNSKLQSMTEKTSDEMRRSSYITTKTKHDLRVEDESRRLVKNDSSSKTMTVGIRRLFRKINVVHQEIKQQLCWVVQVPASSFKFPKPLFLTDTSVENFPTPPKPASRLNIRALRFGHFTDEMFFQSTVTLTEIAPYKWQASTIFLLPTKEVRDAAMHALVESPVRAKDYKAVSDSVKTNVNGIKEWTQNDDKKTSKVTGINIFWNSPTIEAFDGTDAAGNWAGGFSVKTETLKEIPKKSDMIVINDSDSITLKVKVNDIKGATVSLDLRRLCILPAFDDYSDFLNGILDFEKAQDNYISQLKAWADKMEKEGRNGHIDTRNHSDLRAEEAIVASDILLSHIIGNETDESKIAQIRRQVYETFSMSDIFLLPDVWDGHARKSRSEDFYPVFKATDPSQLPMVLGWNQQIDADLRRNELINSKTIQIVIPVKEPAKPADDKNSKKETSRAYDASYLLFGGTLSSGQWAFANRDNVIMEPVTKEELKLIDEIQQNLSPEQNRLDLQSYIKDRNSKLKMNRGRPDLSDKIQSDYMIKVPVAGYFYDIIE